MCRAAGGVAGLIISLLAKLQEYRDDKKVSPSLSATALVKIHTLQSAPKIIANGRTSINGEEDQEKEGTGAETPVDTSPE